MSVLCLTAAAALIGTAHAEVVSQADNGFALAHTVSVEAEPGAVWTALINPASWWNPAHSWSGDSTNFSLDPAAGGCFCETWQNEEGQPYSVEHLRVAALIPGNQLTLRGALGPLQTYGVDGALTFLIVGQGDGTSDVMVTYNVGGYLDGMDQWAGPVDGVIAEQAERLARLINTGSPDTE
ncbi:ATPase [Aquisalinus flavus]|nr:ATPase [Aquisalinus flavus]